MARLPVIEKKKADRGFHKFLQAWGRRLRQHALSLQAMVASTEGATEMALSAEAEAAREQAAKDKAAAAAAKAEEMRQHALGLQAMVNTTGAATDIALSAEAEAAREQAAKDKAATMQVCRSISARVSDKHAHRRPPPTK